ncbi:hypothetical protein [Nostoc sp. 'Peltigera malacea cyanobiont' DB3992]|uniref:hypothetical protein n=1 Tax=Nostoc sp. 'Peltigera malacea cyanobiont' DB3992 TaxID=1206980 RepID=UPI00211E76C5|nr:hypothetical protein [Nostoc sp. 'Peltigera malacea cyanobiont' DB3992]
MTKKEGTVPFTVYTTPETRQAFKSACTVAGKTMNEVMEDFMKEYGKDFIKTKE